MWHSRSLTSKLATLNVIRKFIQSIIHQLWQLESCIVALLFILALASLLLILRLIVYHLASHTSIGRKVHRYLLYLSPQRVIFDLQLVTNID